MSERLRIEDHRRDSAGLTYVYPVISRRAGGLSVGINLNTNNACNWACVYCQVPGLVRGGPQAIDLALLQRELGGFLDQVLRGDFLQRQAPEGARRLADVAFSGNGEPTTAAEFEAAVDRVLAEMRAQGVAAGVPLRLITNGSQIHRAGVRRGIAAMGRAGGEVWFKVDRATAAGIVSVNQVRREPGRIVDCLRQCAGLAPTWVQTCWFGIDGATPTAAEVEAYLELLRSAGKGVRGVLLYGIARPSMQPAAARLSPLPEAELRRLAARIEATGLAVSVSP